MALALEWTSSNSSSRLVSVGVVEVQRSADLALAIELGRVDAGLSEVGVADNKPAGSKGPGSFNWEETNDSHADVTRRFCVSFNSCVFFGCEQQTVYVRETTKVH